MENEEMSLKSKILTAMGMSEEAEVIALKSQVSDLEAKIEEMKTDEEKQKLRSELLNRQWRNKAVSDTYEPGSTFKIITVSSALDIGCANESDLFTCT